MKSQLEAWDTQIEHLDARTDIVLMKLEDRYYSLLQTLRAREEAIRGNLKELDAACEQCWESAKARLDKASSEMESALSMAAQELE